jgi:hypothetical protein
LVAGTGRSILPQGKGSREYEDLNARVPLNFGPLGEAVASGQQGRVTKSDQQPISIPGFDWLREEGVRCHAISPIRFKGEVLGSLVGLTREYAPEVSQPWAAIFADHGGQPLPTRAPLTISNVSKLNWNFRILACRRRWWRRLAPV